MTAPQVTLLLPLNGRPLHTLRLMFHLNAIKFPFPLIIADGCCREPVRSLLNGHEHFPDLDYDYLQYADDENYSCFYQKMADANTRVKTPYVMLIDNDDFPLAEGIAENARFLDRNPDYISCGGGVLGFSLQHSDCSALEAVVGSLGRVTHRYSDAYSPGEASQDDALMRITHAYKQGIITYYHVFRTDKLALLHQEIRELNFADLEIHEAYFLMRAFSMGKAKSDGTTLSYMRQYGTSTQYSHRVDWVEHLLKTPFNIDFNNMVSRLSQAIANISSEGEAEIRESISGLYAEKLRHDLRVRYYTEHRYITWAKFILRPIIDLYERAAKITHMLFAGRFRKHQTASLMIRLKADGGKPEYVTAFEKELAAIESTLVSGGFADFVRTNTPELLVD